MSTTELHQPTINKIKMLSVGEKIEIRGTRSKDIIDAVEYINEQHDRGHEVFQSINYSIVKRLR